MQIKLSLDKSKENLESCEGDIILAGSFTKFLAFFSASEFIIALLIERSNSELIFEEVTSKYNSFSEDFEDLYLLKE